MARIKIIDLPRDVKVSQEEMRQFIGGVAHIKSVGAAWLTSHSPNLRYLSPQPEPPDIQYPKRFK